MKSSAPQTTMSINLAPMVKKHLPKGAKPLRVLRKELDAKGEKVSQRQFAKDMIDMEEDSGGKIKSMMYPHNGHCCKWYWEVK